MLKQEKTFNEREVSTFKQLFGVVDGPDFSAIARQSQGKGRGTFREADSEHNDAMLNTLMPRKNTKSILSMKSLDSLPRNSVDTLPLPRQHFSIEEEEKSDTSFAKFKKTGLTKSKSAMKKKKIGKQKSDNSANDISAISNTDIAKFQPPELAELTLKKIEDEDLL